MPQESERVLGVGQFRVEIDGIVVAGFASCSGLSVSTEVMIWAEGGDNGRVHRLPVRSRVENLVLRRGYAGGDELWRWREELLRGDRPIKRRSLSLVLCGDDGAEVTRWNCAGVWPVRWDGPTLQAGAAEVAIELLELAVDRVERR